ncbi:hypothetical protein G4G27_15250 [Sphingomonas sp. So64.6b]|uniref:hypothetical protein n=1 Tax=Sphingomonas sp. So64.6b TaxID=2997354 RepID=UPI001602BAE6|nr:hypothetical protein [Sphingomonas sp. So64.6b]QNA85204.1 hypothetical protein G4G27_15250 [Sphingomonas sp. So64.6b]
MAEAVDQGSFELNRPPAESEPDSFGGASDRPIPTGEERSEIEHEQLLRSAAAIAGDQLRDATQRLFERMAEQHGISVEGARLAALYSHAELIRMAARREREALA